jgi:hypothetical protein
MDPVSRRDHNFVYQGPTPEIGDLPCYRQPGEVWSHWKPTPEELELLNHGGHVALGLFHEPIPPISIGVVAAEAPPGTNGKVVHLADRRD